MLYWLLTIGIFLFFSSLYIFASSNIRARIHTQTHIKYILTNKCNKTGLIAPMSGMVAPGVGVVIPGMLPMMPRYRWSPQGPLCLTAAPTATHLLHLSQSAAQSTAVPPSMSTATAATVTATAAIPIILSRQPHQLIKNHHLRWILKYLG